MPRDFDPDLSEMIAFTEMNRDDEIRATVVLLAHGLVNGENAISLVDEILKESHNLFHETVERMVKAERKIAEMEIDGDR